MEEPEAIVVFCWLRSNLGQTGETLKGNRVQLLALLSSKIQQESEIGSPRTAGAL